MGTAAQGTPGDTTWEQGLPRPCTKNRTSRPIIMKGIRHKVAQGVCTFPCPGVLPMASLSTFLARAGSAYGPFRQLAPGMQPAIWHAGHRVLLQDLVCLHVLARHVLPPRCISHCAAGCCPFQGKYTGRFKRGSEGGESGARAGVEMTERDHDTAEEVVAIAEEIGRTPSQVAVPRHY
jgi:hypothetical protein